VRTTLPFLPESSSSAGAHAELGHYTIMAYADGPCAPGWSQCSVTTQGSAGAPIPTSTLTIDDRAAPWGDGFETLAPGTGEVEAAVSAAWTLDGAGFAQFSAQYFDSVSVLVLWTSA
jgi:hypothetical protein